MLDSIQAYNDRCRYRVWIMQNLSDQLYLALFCPPAVHGQKPYRQLNPHKLPEIISANGMDQVGIRSVPNITCLFYRSSADAQL